MLILVINAGSSSIKYSLIDMSNEKLMSKGSADRIGLENSRFRHYVGEKLEVELHEAIANHEAAVKLIVQYLTHPEHGIIKDMNTLAAVGHRMSHGAEKLIEPVVVDENVMAILKNNIPLAPLHMPPAITGIEIFQKLLPQIPMIGVFDTAFHQTMPEKAFLYAIPYEFYEKYKIRRYGFHGPSHKYVSIQAAKLLGRPYNSIKTVTCHLGSGSSITAVDRGKSVDSSMGFTPLVGVPMGTRCGDIDISIVGYLMENEKLTYSEVINILNKESGLLGLSGITSDNRDLCRLASEGNKRAKIALDVFCYNVKKYIGAYAAAMGGLDCIVFTGGIGENGDDIREEVCKDLDFLGAKFCPDKNLAAMKNRGQDMILSTDDSKVKICVIYTDEELMIAQEAAGILKS